MDPNSGVGVVADSNIRSIGEASEPYFYIPFFREPTREVTFFIEATDAHQVASAARKTLAGVQTELTPISLVTMESLARFAAADYQTASGLVGFLAAIGLVLTSAGVFGMTSYLVKARIHEFGVRVALGLEPRRVVFLCLKSTTVLIIGGVALGMPLALTAGTAVASRLFHVKSWDTPSLALAGFVLTATTMAAASLPAIQVAFHDPWRALHESYGGSRQISMVRSSKTWPPDLNVCCVPRPREA